MKLFTTVTLLSAALFLSAGDASADFTGVSATSSIVIPGTTTYRLWANFNDPGDQLLVVGGEEMVQPLDFVTSTFLVNEGGAATGLKMEDFPGAPFTGPSDSWVTIGGMGNFGDNDTDYTPGFLGSDGVTNVIKGSSFHSDNGHWFDSNPGTPVTDSGAGILIAQLTIADEVGGEPGTWSLAGIMLYAPAFDPDGMWEVPFSIAVPEPVIGDVDLSGCVDDDDLSLLLANWNIGDEWGEGDLNENGTVNDDDLSLLLANWGAGCSPAPAAVPEPATLALLALGGLAVLIRRRCGPKERT